MRAGVWRLSLIVGRVSPAAGRRGKGLLHAKSAAERVRFLLDCDDYELVGRRSRQAGSS
jgi:hypothetical protein